MKSRILFISHDSNYTGAPLQLHKILKHLQLDDTWEITVLLKVAGNLASHFADLYPTYFIEKAQVISLNSPTPTQFESIRAFFLHIQPDVVYANTVMNGRSIRVAQKLSIPVIMHVREMTALFEKQLLDYRHELLSCDHYVCNSKIVKQYIEHDYAIPDSKLTVIHSGLDFAQIEHNRLEQSKEQVRARLGIAPDALVIGGVGTISHNKGFDLWLQTARRVFRQCPDLNPHFVWVGNDTNPYAHALKHDISALALTERVHCIGETTNPYMYIQAMDIFVMSSRDEPLGMVCAEAAYLGVPTAFFSCSGGSGEIITPDCGLAVEYLDSYEMAEAVISLARDADLRRKFAAVGHQRVCDDFSIHSTCSKVKDVIMQMV